jgi:hypothetical protein
MDKSIPRWQKVIALIYVLVFAALMLGLGFAYGWHWLGNRLSADFLPVDNSNVFPNILASGIQYTVIAVIVWLCWPPVRRKIHEFADRKLLAVHEHLKNAAADREVLHQKLDHLIFHSPDVPEFKKDAPLVKTRRSPVRKRPIT